MYIQFLANRNHAPTSLKNYLSGARSWVYEHYGTTEAFNSPEAARMIKTVIKKSNHVVKRALPLSLHHLKIIIDYLNCNPLLPKAIKPCILLGYSCMLRASNLLCSSGSDWSGPHSLLCSDLHLSSGSLNVRIRSSKTTSVPNFL